MTVTVTVTGAVVKVTVAATGVVTIAVVDTVTCMLGPPVNCTVWVISSSAAL